MNDYQATKVVMGTVRFSYLNAFEPKSIQEGGDKKYSVSIIIPKSDPKMVSAIEGAIIAAKEAGKAKWGGKIPARLKMPLRDGDEERPDDEAYANSYFVNASCKTRPGVVDANRQPIIDQDELYSGCYGYVSVNFYAFDSNGSKGVACGLNNLMKTAEGAPLGGRNSAESDFENVQTDSGDSFMD